MHKRTLQTLFLVVTLVVLTFGVIPAFRSVFAPTLEIRERTDTGIVGFVTIGPVCPVVQSGNEDACADRPYSAPLQLTTVSGKVLEAFTSDDLGKFTLHVPPGDYYITSRITGQMPSLSPVLLRVIDGEFATATLQFDSGIR